MKEFWNDRYREPDPVYGWDPNEFIKEQLNPLEPGQILFPAEGQGRNAVFAASLGWQVDAFDYSEEGRSSALDFARLKNVTINYALMDLRNFQAIPEYYDVIALSYTHVHVAHRGDFFEKLVASLKLGGKIIMEVFSKGQLGRSSGGPKDLELLYSCSEIELLFQELETSRLDEVEIALAEGKYHEGLAMVIRYIGTKD